MNERDQTKPPEIGELPVQPNLTMEPVQEASDIAIDAELQAFIGRQLRAAYDEVLNEPVPDRFMALLEQLEQAESARADGEPGTPPAAGHSTVGQSAVGQSTVSQSPVSQSPVSQSVGEAKREDEP